MTRAQVSNEMLRLQQLWPPLFQRLQQIERLEDPGWLTLATF